MVREREGIDLRAYRRGTVERRATQRLHKLGCSDYRGYARRMAEDEAEAHHLLAHITIKVSRFFRDADVFGHLRDAVLPDLVRQIGADGELRVWSAGCGNGEEPYSMAVFLADMSREGWPIPAATIWGTDIDEEALAVATRGLYPEGALAETSPELIAAYWARRPGRLGSQYELSDDIRRRVVFARHDLLSGTGLPAGPRSPAIPCHLVLCRNVLIYFQRHAQEQVLQLLTHSLAPGGYLCLGEAEQLTKAQAGHYETIDRRAGLYRRTREGLSGGSTGVVS